jgi:CheY-like chemotaxis protein
VAVAYDGASALMVLPSIQPALVFVDLVMPALDGAELARIIRAENLGQNAVLVALTGWVPPSKQENDPLLLFDDVILKPIHLDRLDMLLRSVFLSVCSRSAEPHGQEATPINGRVCQAAFGQQGRLPSWGCGAKRSFLIAERFLNPFLPIVSH